MADFSSSDISEAKKRVEEMRRRAKNIAADDSPLAEGRAENADTAPMRNSTPDSAPFVSNGIFDLIGRDSSSALILALILVLSKENADNMLILALLYILL